MVAAGEEVAQFVGEKNGQQSGGEGQADKESGGVFVEESEGAEEFRREKRLDRENRRWRIACPRPGRCIA